jgi:hypothetical protein
MKPARKGSGAARSHARNPSPQSPTQSQAPQSPPAVCRRCGTPGPVGDDGFCEKCEKALEQACL